MTRSGTADPEHRRFWRKVHKTDDGCWLWTGGLNHGGYGVFTLAPQFHGIDGRTVYAHRWAYQHLVGPIPDHLVIDHLCRTTNCVNPAHLEAVALAENSRRAGRNKRHGHPPVTHPDPHPTLFT